MSFRRWGRDAAALAVRGSGVPWLLRRTHRRRHASILLYHDPLPEVMEAHLAYLASRFTFTTLDTVVDAVLRRDWSRVPEGALVITLDDGHRGNRALLPAFQRYTVRPTLYLCSQVVATTRRFWFQERGVDVPGLKRLHDRGRLDELARTTGFEPSRSHDASERQALSAQEIAEMAPWVDFGAHSRFHPILTQCVDDDAWLEIDGSRREIEAITGRPCRHFSYPNGDYGPREVEYARKAGFASARTVDLGWTHVASDPYRLKAFGIADDASVHVLAAQLSGIPNYLRRLAQGSRGGLWPTTPTAPR
jgi:peptidoglycan/xylan/chitin deacetylase (PgdA/CDA1 family)